MFIYWRYLIMCRLKKDYVPGGVEIVQIRAAAVALSVKLDTLWFVINDLLDLLIGLFAM